MKYTHENKKRPKPEEPAWVIRLEECGTEQEIHKLEQAYERRDATQQEISRSGQKLQNRTSSNYNTYLRGEMQQSTSATIDAGSDTPDAR